MPIVKIKEKFQVTIPNETRRKIHLEVGDILEVVTKDNLIILKPKAVVDRVDVETAINEGLKDIKDGRVYGPFGSAGEMLHSLHKNAKKLKAK
ncbi:MAG: AbrB/MazE/SpoVT family DNA-binding domain-containing protein [Nitrospira sp.]|nr:AbrB/MazE/SpoVT family DNA-binding domain-containing protein [Nitrospira sp.]